MTRALIVFALAACGTDGKRPVPPAAPPQPPAAPADAAPEAQCTRRYLPDEQLRAAPADGERITITELIARKPRSARFVTDGWVVARRICPPCPEGADCKPCEPHIVLSETRAAGIKQPISYDLDLRIHTSVPERFEDFQRYQVTLWACESTEWAVELRGYRRLP